MVSGSWYDADYDLRTKGSSNFCFLYTYMYFSYYSVFLWYRVLSYCLVKLGCGHGYNVLCHNFNNVA